MMRDEDHARALSGEVESARAGGSRHSVLDFGFDRFALAAFSFPISCPDATMGSNRTAGLLKMELVGS
jgi:hypothetical protein